MMRSHDLQRLLDFNPGVAARRSGIKSPQLLAGALAEEHHRRLRALLQEFEDSYLGQPFDEFCSLAQGLGFEILQVDEFWMGGPARSAFMHRGGLLLCTDSYQGMVNQARLLLRSRGPLPGSEPHGRIFRCALDVRSGLRTRLENIREPLPCCLQADAGLLPDDLAARLEPRRWPRGARRKLGAKQEIITPSRLSFKQCLSIARLRA